MTTGCPVLIVDDEPQSRSLIRKLLSLHFPQLVAAEAENVSSAVEMIRLLEPALVFLDVQMEGETGFGLLDTIGTPAFEIIFTTAYSEFAVKAFRYSAVDYLLKPIDTDNFKTAVEKALRQMKNRASGTERINLLKTFHSGNGLPEKISIPVAAGFLFVTIPEIMFCHATGNYTEFWLEGKQKIVSSHTLGYYEELLSDAHFFRVNRSYLVNLSHIQMYKRGDGGAVCMSNGAEIEVSRNHKEAFLKLFNR